MKVVLILLTVLLAIGCGDSDPRSDYPNLNNFVEPYDRNLKTQFYLDAEAVEFEAPKTILFKRGQADSYEVEVRVDFLKAGQYRIVGANFPKWLELSKSTEKPDAYILEGDVPADFYAGGPDGTHQIRLVLKLNGKQHPRVQKRLGYYETEKVILVKVVDGV